MTFEYYTKEIYGKQHYYIVEKGFQQIHYHLTGCKTLLEKHFQLYQSLGLNFKQVLTPKE